MAKAIELRKEGKAVNSKTKQPKQSRGFWHGVKREELPQIFQKYHGVIQPMRPRPNSKSLRNSNQNVGKPMSLNDMCNFAQSINKDQDEPILEKSLLWFQLMGYVAINFEGEAIPPVCDHANEVPEDFYEHEEVLILGPPDKPLLEPIPVVHQKNLDENDSSSSSSSEESEGEESDSDSESEEEPELDISDAGLLPDEDAQDLNIFPSMLEYLGFKTRVEDAVNDDAEEDDLEGEEPSDEDPRAYIDAANAKDDMEEDNLQCLCPVEETPDRTNLYMIISLVTLVLLMFSGIANHFGVPFSHQVYYVGKGWLTIAWVVFVLIQRLYFLWISSQTIFFMGIGVASFWITLIVILVFYFINRPIEQPTLCPKCAFKHYSQFPNVHLDLFGELVYSTLGQDKTRLLNKELISKANAWFTRVHPTWRNCVKVVYIDATLDAVYGYCETENLFYERQLNNTVHFMKNKSLQERAFIPH